MTAHLSKWVRHYSQRLPWRTLSLTLSALLLYWLLGPAPEALTYEREAIAAGEWWRLLTGHWVHSDLEHLLFDVTAMAIVLYLFEKSPLWQLTLLLTTATVVIDAWLWWQMPWLQSYCGLSGLLNALLSCGLLVLWKRSSDPAYLLIGALAALKITIEISLGDTLFTTTAWAAVPEAHAAGMVTGLLLGIFFTYIKNLFWKTKKDPISGGFCINDSISKFGGLRATKTPDQWIKKRIGISTHKINQNHDIHPRYHPPDLRFFAKVVIPTPRQTPKIPKKGLLSPYNSPTGEKKHTKAYHRP